MSNYDLIIIGGGSGGVAAAIESSNNGAKCLVIERNRLGGVCVNLGCIPKKFFWYASEINSKLANADKYGVSKKVNKFDWQQFNKNFSFFIKTLNKDYENKLLKHEVSQIYGNAKLISANEVSVNENIYRAKNIIIAAGASPRYPDILNAKLGITSDDLFHLPKQPRKLAIIGAGYIAVELSSLLSNLDIEISLFIRKDNLLKNFDPIIQKTVKNNLKSQGVKIYEGHIIDKINEVDAKLSVSFINQKTYNGFDQVIWAIGREANTAQFQCENVNLKCNENKQIIVDEYNNTNIPNIYAVGDVCNKPALTPVAIATGRDLAKRLYAKQAKGSHNDNLIPTVIFSNPPSATVGLTELEACKKYGNDNIKVYQHSFVPLYDALLPQRIKTHIKLITAGKDEVIIGLHMVGSNVDEILQGFAVAMNAGLTKKQLDQTIPIHPISAEELINLG